MSQKKTGKKLPQWLSGLPTHKIKAPTSAQVTSVEDCLPELTYEGHITYSTNQQDCDLLCDDIISLCDESESRVVGFDLEWPVTYTQGQEGKVALMQICTCDQKCYLFHIAAMSEFPRMLKTLLHTESIQFTGIGIEGDLWKLERNFDIRVLPIIKTRMVDLSVMANEVLRSSERWSLDNLTRHLLGKTINKDPVVRKCEWDKWPLTTPQQKYAATDAYASLLLYEELQRRKTR